MVTAQDENGLRLVKNGNAGTDGDPVKWGFPRMDGYYGSKSGGLYLNTDDNLGDGLFVAVSGWFSAGGFGTNAAAIGIYVGDGTLDWAKRVAVTRPSGPGPYVSGSSGPKKAFTDGDGTSLEYFGNDFDRAGNFVARRPQVPELQTCTVFKTTQGAARRGPRLCGGDEGRRLCRQHPAQSGGLHQESAPAARARGRRRSSS